MDDDKRIRDLAQLIRYHQNLYYNATPELSDQEFDALWDELGGLDPEHPLLREIGQDTTVFYQKRPHIIFMHSQDKVASEEAFMLWSGKLSADRFIVQHKLDGMSLELQYIDGTLHYGISRGDGKVGDDLTHSVIKIPGIPHTVTSDFSGAIRGEVVISRTQHARHFPDNANCRNTVNGVMKKKSSEGAEFLNLLCYDVKYTQGHEFTDEMEKLTWLSREGFSVVTTELCNSPDAVIEVHRRIQKERRSLSFDIDGLVIKSMAIDEEDTQRSRPERQVAFKFPAEETNSLLTDIVWNENGHRYTPIACIDPVQLAGTTVKRASLFNPQYISAQEIGVGASVVVTKRGDIIPRIERVVNLPFGSHVPLFPLTCPSCGQAIQNDRTQVYCPNALCIRRSSHRIQKWIEVLQIRELGVKRVNKLIETGLLRSVSDLYELKHETMMQIAEFGDKNIQKILGELKGKSDISFAQLLAGFDIAGVGEISARKIVQSGINSLEELANAKVEDLQQVPGLGKIISEHLHKEFHQLLPELTLLLEKGYVRLHASEHSDFLTGKSFCFTGTLTRFTRNEASELVMRYGGEVRSSVGKGLSYLVMNDVHTASSKARAARELQISLLTEEEFSALFPS